MSRRIWLSSSKLDGQFSSLRRWPLPKQDRLELRRARSVRSSPAEGLTTLQKPRAVTNICSQVYYYTVLVTPLQCTLSPRSLSIYLSIYIYICINVYIYICIYVYVYIYRYTYIYIYINCMYLCMHAWSLRLPRRLRRQRPRQRCLRAFSLLTAGIL